MKITLIYVNDVEVVHAAPTGSSGVIGIPVVSEVGEWGIVGDVGAEVKVIGAALHTGLAVRPDDLVLLVSRDVVDDIVGVLGRHYRVGAGGTRDAVPAGGVVVEAAYKKRREA